MVDELRAFRSMPKAYHNLYIAYMRMYCNFVYYSSFSFTSRCGKVVVIVWDF